MNIPLGKTEKQPHPGTLKSLGPDSSSGCGQRLVLVPTPHGADSTARACLLLRGKEQKPTFHDTCSNPGWNVAEKMQEKFLKYISLQPQYIPYACRLLGREPGELPYLW